MKYSEGRGIKTQRWSQNEIARSDDLTLIGGRMYQNTTDVFASLAYQKVIDEVITGLVLSFSSGMVCVLTAGVAVSFSGQYIVSGAWGFSPETGAPFSVMVPEDTSVVFDNGSGMANPRIDTLEIRPVQTPYNAEFRNLKDPIVGSVSSSAINTALEYGFEYQIIKGTESASPSAPASTAGWIKLAEVSVAVSQTTLAESDIITFQRSREWTTDASATVHASDAGWTTTTTLLNGWTGTVRYIKRAGMVTVNIIVDASAKTGVSCITLPAEYRPANPIQTFALSGVSGSVAVNIQTTGNIESNATSTVVRMVVTYPVIT